MLINKSNFDLMYTKELYMHDHVVGILEFCRDNRRLKFNMITAKLDKNYTLEFIDVSGFYMTACNFIGSCECVYYISLLPDEERKILPKLEEKWDNLPGLASFRENYAEYMELLIEFSSGDELGIACREIEINGLVD